MEPMEQLGVSKIDGKNRTYIPEAVTKALKINGGNNWLSWEQDETGQIFVFKGHLRFLRTKNYQPPESGEERTIQGGSGSGKTQPNMDEKGGEIPGRKL